MIRFDSIREAAICFVMLMAVLSTSTEYGVEFRRVEILQDIEDKVAEDVKEETGRDGMERTEAV